MPATTDSNMEIARRAFDEARADLATWSMMARLNSVDALPQEAQVFFAGYCALRKRPRTSETEAAEATVRIVYKSYYARMGGTGAPPDIKIVPRTRAMPDDDNSNVTPFRKIKPSAPPPAKKKLPVALIFIGLVILAVAYNYLSKGML